MSPSTHSASRIALGVIMGVVLGVVLHEAGSMQRLLKLQGFLTYGSASLDSSMAAYSFASSTAFEPYCCDNGSTENAPSCTPFNSNGGYSVVCKPGSPTWTPTQANDIPSCIDHCGPPPSETIYTGTFGFPCHQDGTCDTGLCCSNAQQIDASQCLLPGQLDLSGQLPLDATGCPIQPAPVPPPQSGDSYCCSGENPGMCILTTNSATADAYCIQGSPTWTPENYYLQGGGINCPDFCENYGGHPTSKKYCCTLDGGYTSYYALQNDPVIPDTCKAGSEVWGDDLGVIGQQEKVAACAPAPPEPIPVVEPCIASDNILVGSLIGVSEPCLNSNTNLCTLQIDSSNYPQCCDAVPTDQAIINKCCAYSNLIAEDIGPEYCTTPPTPPNCSIVESSVDYNNCCTDLKADTDSKVIAKCCAAAITLHIQPIATLCPLPAPEEWCCIPSLNECAQILPPTTVAPPALTECAANLGDSCTTKPCCNQWECINGFCEVP